MFKRTNKVWAMFLSAAIVITNFPAAMAEDSIPEDGSIASFEDLDSSIANQTVTAGTELSRLNLPETLKAAIYHVTENPVSPEDEASSSGEVQTVTSITTTEEKIPVAWDSDPDYDDGTAGTYVFTANVDGYPLSDGAVPPVITVTVEETLPSETDDPGDAEVIAVTSFDELDSGVKFQAVELGSPQESLNLPSTLYAYGYTVANNPPPPQKQSPLTA